MALIRAITIGLTGIGTLLFGALLGWIIFAPDRIDEHARSMAVAEVRQRVEMRLEGIEASVAGRGLDYATRQLAPELRPRMERLEEEFGAGADRLVASSVTNEIIIDLLMSACRIDCDRDEGSIGPTRARHDELVAKYGVALDRLRAIATSEYDRTVNEIRAELTIFAAINFVALLAAFLLAIGKPQEIRRLLTISVLLTVGTLIAATWFLFGRDWIAVIIFSHYWGWSYAILLGLIIAALADIAFNKARIVDAAVGSLGNS